MADNINALIKLVYEKELVQSQTELRALQAQINPHFLYNTLEAFYWSLSDKGEEELADLVVAMSHMFRYVIGGSGKQEWVTIGDELEHIERYLHIMRMRFGLRLFWSVDCPDSCRATPIPKLLIQPLVENAIVHGIEGKVEGGTIRIAIEELGQQDGHRLAVIVEDNGAGMEAKALESLLLSIRSGTPVSTKGTGLGLRNVKRRLELYYQNQAGALSVESTPGAGTVVQFELPRGEGENA
jgi:two-component system, sensor histidine kinase YesM